MEWPPGFPDLNLIENLCSVLKRCVYQDGLQFSSKVGMPFVGNVQSITQEGIISTNSVDQWRNLHQTLAAEGHHNLMSIVIPVFYYH